MDRIQRALDKAKQRAAEADAQPVKVKSRTVEQVDEIESEQLSLESINYTQTAVVETPTKVLEQNRIVAGFYNDPNSSIFRMLRSQVLKKMRANQWQTLAITSPTAGEGKSVVAANLAVAMAMELNQTVLLVDMDMRNPSVAKYFGLNVKKGLREYLSSEIALSEVLVNPGIKRLVILPGVGRAEDSAELLSSPKMANLVEDLKSYYHSRVIIFDVPPVLQTDDVLLSTGYFDSTLLVLEDGKNSEANITKALQLLEGSHLLGTVLNKSDRAPQHQSY